MFPEIGHFALMLALMFALALAVVPLLGYVRHNAILLASAKPLTYVMTALTGLSFVILAVAFAQDDFSVLYVSQHSNSLLPIWYKLSAVWGGHEGSLLLWVTILVAWASAVAYKSDSLPNSTGPVVLGVLGIVATGFLSFILFTSSPFIRVLPDQPMDGVDLNPLLQDIGLIVHPPMLYMGYVGFSVAFAFAIAALITGNLNASWARWARPWTNVSWAFLTLGIALGSWWAYYELGWGGWWFWDPVENASLMPWLAGTALVHSLAVTEKRGVFKSWTVLLAIFTFSLSLLGTFLVRSGVLTSVHAFAADPTRGVFILALLVIIIGSSLLLYAVRAQAVKSSASFGLSGRESWLLINNILLTVLTLTVLLGTLYPLIFDAFGLGKISVGAPYFNAVFGPIALLLIVFMGIGPVAKWHRTQGKLLWRKAWLSALLSVVLAALVFTFHEFDALMWASFAIALWLVLMCVRDYWDKVRTARQSMWQRARQLPRSYYGMQLAHIGVAVTLIGVIFVSMNSTETIVRMAPGDRVNVGNYEFEFTGTRHVEGPNYSADMAVINVYQADQLVTQMLPQKRLYKARQQMMTEAALHPGFTRDLYVSLGEPLADDAWGVRIYIKSFVRWIWLGAILMTIGGLVAAWDKRYRRKTGA
ncbi:heme lyase CcmF/NrfE family subunit [Marinomonas ostreistagni]|uniref:heme lyase CcmF/NrfE family subunit n=1 Tax=Marinomonas ostreistagni TaxID=359209 RepID=UPI001950C45A|nr:heme lyase CcmF/NrfE family subunit [Marinomonas ostreistagni]MBM6551280.1 heme lyase CcmF/NrfE family subunit [Marinomonas ostreistagni]